VSDVQLAFLIATLLFGGVTAYGLRTGKMLAFYDFARREDDLSWFRFWAFANGGLAVLCLSAFLVTLAVGA
jgi:hypothetical protein